MNRTIGQALALNKVSTLNCCFAARIIFLF
jgi:hypothetical protein